MQSVSFLKGGVGWSGGGGWGWGRGAICVRVPACLPFVRACLGASAPASATTVSVRADPGHAHRLAYWRDQKPAS